jgi:uncharacterized RDD family membrane protein YckC
MNRIGVGIAFAVLYIVDSFLPFSGVFSVSGGDDNVVVRAGSSLFALVVSGLALTLAIGVMYKTPPPTISRLPTLSSRMVALVIDLCLVQVLGAAIAGLVASAFEYYFTSSFQWGFTRDFQRPTDWLTIGAMFGTYFIVMMAYFGIALSQSRQTIGAYLLGLMVVRDSREKITTWMGAKRSLLAFVSLLTFRFSSDAQGRMWHDIKTRTKVVCTN